jgi:hypothetical protein
MARGDGLFRQWELIKVLQAHRFGVSTKELCARLECNKRTVQRVFGGALWRKKNESENFPHSSLHE